MFQKILVAIDGSDHSIRALEAAARVAKADGARLTVVTAAYVPPLYKADLNQELKQSFRDSAQAILEDGRRVLARLDVEAQMRLLEDRPADAIVGLANQGGFDVVVLGRRGLNSTADKRLGGVSDAVLRQVDCSVMLVH